MKYKLSTLKIMGTLIAVIGLCSLIFGNTFIHMLRYLDISILKDKYGPDAFKHEMMYENLYAWAEHLINHRNYYSRLFYTTVGLSGIIFGITLFIWSIDRNQLLKQVKQKTMNQEEKD